MNDLARRREEIARLRRSRARTRGARISVCLLLVLAIGSWFVEDFGVSELVTGRRLSNLGVFLPQLVPYPLQSSGFDLGVLLGWLASMTRSRGLDAGLNTLAMSMAAIFLAGLAGAVLSVFGARTLMHPSPYLPAPIRTRRLPQMAWWSLSGLARGLMIFVRAIPEYVWGFLFLAMLGPVAWPLVLALAVHNAGILGRLGAEVVENTPSEPLTALRALGATRTQIVLSALFPLAFSRFLLFFLYRWETCVREATVLGMLGISSLGFWIQDARARNHYDEMFYFILVGGILVLLGDLASAAAREWVRRQG